MKIGQKIMVKVNGNSIRNAQVLAIDTSRNLVEVKMYGHKGHTDKTVQVPMGCCNQAKAREAHERQRN